jgi:deoxyadenosine/deoxycytidine kinase
MANPRSRISEGPRIVVVGPCAAGKTTLVNQLKERGYDAYVCGQEHSEIATLFRHGQPDIVIALDLDLTTLRARRGDEWPQDIYTRQVQRLEVARSQADLVIDTSDLNELQALDAVLTMLTRTSESTRGPSAGTAASDHHVGADAGREPPFPPEDSDHRPQ